MSWIGQDGWPYEGARQGADPSAPARITPDDVWNVAAQSWESAKLPLNVQLGRTIDGLLALYGQQLDAGMPTQMQVLKNALTDLAATLDPVTFAKEAKKAVSDFPPLPPSFESVRNNMIAKCDEVING